MPNADTFKKLLEEMATKESLYAEELKVIEQEIEQLESRIITCRERLGTVGDDKGTVNSIAERYTKEVLELGKIALDFSIPLRKSVVSTASNPEPAVKESPKTNGKSTAKAQNGSKSKAEEVTTAKTDVKSSGVSKPEAKPEPKVQEAAKTEVKAEAKPQPKAEAKDEEKADSKTDEGFILDLSSGEEAGKDKPSEEENQSGESEDETIKSINDALRGLFR
jgi:hypothetical protein